MFGIPLRGHLQRFLYRRGYTDRNEPPGRVEVVFTALINNPNISICRSIFIRNDFMLGE